MNKLAMIGAALALGGLASTVPATAAAPEEATRDAGEGEMSKGEAELAKMLDGRKAGDPVNCIPANRTNNTTIVDRTAIVYRVGGTLYVNRPRNAESLRDDRILVTRIYSSQLCRSDSVQLRDRAPSMMWSGFVILGDFVPYRKADDKSTDKG